MDPLRKAALLTLEGLKVPNKKQIVAKCRLGDECQCKAMTDGSKRACSAWRHELMASEWAFTNLVWMKQHCIDEIETLPIDKINRWIGFIQGALAAQGMLDVTKERDRTRPFFHEAYNELEIDIPESLTKP